MASYNQNEYTYNPNQQNELIQSMQDMFSKAKKNVYNIPDLNSIEEDAYTSYSKSRSKSQYKSSSNANTTTYKSKHGKVRSKSTKNRTGSMPSSRRHHSSYQSHYGAEGMRPNQEQSNHYQYSTGSYNIKNHKEARKQAAIDDMIAELNRKVSKTSVSKNRDHKQNYDKKPNNEPIMMMASPTKVTIDSVTETHNMHYYSGIEDPRKKLLEAEQLLQHHREARRLQEQFDSYNSHRTIRTPVQF